MTLEHTVRLARLPQLRLAYIDTSIPAASSEDAVDAAVSTLWDTFNTWRLETRPALGRIDIAAIGWRLKPPTDGDPAPSTFRAAVPIRGDYKPLPPTRTTLFPGGAFVYCYADDADEMPKAFAAVHDFIERKGYVAKSGGIELYKFHYNLEQHPCDCGVLVATSDGSDPLPPESSGPLKIAHN